MNCIWSVEELSEECKESIIVPIYNKGDKMDLTNHRGIPLLHKIVPSIILSELTKLLGIISVGVNITDHLLLKFLAFVKYCRNFQESLLFS
jgi:hypothetical protein